MPSTRYAIRPIRLPPDLQEKPMRGEAARQSTVSGYMPAPLEAWLLASALYVAGVAVARAVAADPKRLLGFDRHAIGQAVPRNAVIAIASLEGVARRALRLRRPP